MVVTIKEKKNFLNWFVANASFSRREVSWILNYLINHESILQNVHFVEGVKMTNRGLQIREVSFSGEPLTLQIDGQRFHDSDQIFHEIRLNWKEPLYIECLFKNAWNQPAYLSVLEDNPYLRWNDIVSEGIIDRIDTYLKQEEIQAQIRLLYQQIDAALEAGDKNAFFELSDEVNRELLRLREANGNHSQLLEDNPK
ncbi:MULTISPECIES: YpiB family protein [Enterococcus]|uniref:YpiB family protein n=1 Tax=Enterococcus TaxID=1350 RepID=UPI00065E6035|nr:MULTISPECIES: YpiB family protein [Enterococcus]KAF1304240.1 hypothetical protein BAU16_02505 [Enterococcus sp. JM9B]